MMPPHDTYIETHLGGGAIMRRKPPALRNIGIDRDAALVELVDDGDEFAGASAEAIEIEDDEDLAPAQVIEAGIARSLKVSPVTVKRYSRRAEEAGLGWPLPESLDDAALERRLLPGAVSVPGGTRFPVPDWSEVHRELRGKGGPWHCARR